MRSYNNSQKELQNEIDRMRFKINQNLLSENNNSKIKITIKKHIVENNSFQIFFDFINNDIVNYQNMLLKISRMELNIKKSLKIQPYFICIESIVPSEYFINFLSNYTDVNGAKLLNMFNNDMDDIVNNLNEVLMDLYFKVKFSEMITDNSLEVSISLSFSPTEIIMTNIILESIIESEENDEFDRNYVDTISGCIANDNEILNKILTRYENPKYLKVLKVGQANSQLILFDKFNLFYDMGLPVFSSDAPYEIAKSVFRKSKNTNVILSHWHEDHYLGVKYFDINGNEKWIAPSTIDCLKNISGNSKLLSLILHIKDKLIMLDSTSLMPVKVNDLTLLKGVGSLCNLNDSGLILSIRNNVDALLPGDCVYKYWPNQISKYPEILIAPHHGAKIKTKPVMLGHSQDRGIAIFSYGKNTYGHPDKDHMGLLLENDYNIFSTTIQGKYTPEVLTLKL